MKETRGNEMMPDFKELSDRLIAEVPKGPFLEIKTNLDPKSNLEENPYAKEKEEKDGQ
ncbi:hypothetical protein [Pseudalkalibacillus caeni]|uniref:hypothetical protein n=1 Tax=Exobacillus caeni TaxID=2574798 RepID=UPI001484D0AE|nr:hypothetical protein [Pseudalkalibacillus caeni]